ncbi:MAG: hypothetical protein ACM3RX_08490 [Methanococcaceae archaeon]
MQKGVTIVLVLLTTTFAFSQNKKQYQYFNNIPTKYGIQHYIDLNISSIVKTLETYIGDSIFSYSIKVDNLSEYQNYDSLEAGRFYPQDEILITNELKFYDYELNFVPKWKHKEFGNNTKFVKGVLIHEFIHLYIYQFIYKCLENNVPINSEYINLNMFPRVKSYYASEFIEEGICEYVVMKLSEGIFSDYKPDWLDGYSEVNVKKFTQLQNTYFIKYQYSRTYVQKIFENNSFRKALFIIFTCKPPSYEELLCPDQYYQRLMKHSEDLN